MEGIAWRSGYGSRSLKTWPANQSRKLSLYRVYELGAYLSLGGFPAFFSTVRFENPKLVRFTFERKTAGFSLKAVTPRDSVCSDSLLGVFIVKSTIRPQTKWLGSKMNDSIILVQ